MGAMALKIPATTVAELSSGFRTQKRKATLWGYRVSLRSRTAVSVAVWNAFYSLAEKHIPDDLYDWQDEELDQFLGDVPESIS